MKIEIKLNEKLEVEDYKYILDKVLKGLQEAEQNKIKRPVWDFEDYRFLGDEEQQNYEKAMKKYELKIQKIVTKFYQIRQILEV